MRIELQKTRFYSGRSYKGPKIRIGSVKEGVIDLKKNDEICYQFATKKIQDAMVMTNAVHIGYPSLFPKDVKKDEKSIGR